MDVVQINSELEMYSTGGHTVLETFPLCMPGFDLNPLPPSAAYMRQWTGSSLLLVTACRLYGTKPLPKPILCYCQFDYCEHFFSWNLNQILSFTFKEIHLKMSSAKMAAFLSRGKWVNADWCSRAVYASICLEVGVIKYTYLSEQVWAFAYQINISQWTIF